MPAGPVLNLGLSPKLGAAIGTAAEKAKAARAEVARLERELTSAATKGAAVNPLLDGQIKKAREAQEQIAKAVKAEKSFGSGAKSLVFFEKLTKARALTDMLKGNFDYDQFVGFLSGAKARKLLEKVGMENAADALQKYSPYAKGAKLLLDIEEKHIDMLKSNFDTHTKINNLYGSGAIDKEQYERLNDYDNWWRRYTPFFDSANEKQNKMLEAPAFASPKMLGYMRQVIKENAWQDLIPQLYEEYVQKVKAERSRQKDFYGAGFNDERDTALQRKIAQEFEMENPGFVELMKKTNRLAENKMSEDAVKYPAHKMSATEAYNYQNERQTAAAVFSEYRRGDIPFNRSD